MAIFGGGGADNPGSLPRKSGREKTPHTPLRILKKCAKGQKIKMKRETLYIIIWAANVP